MAEQDEHTDVSVEPDTPVDHVEQKDEVVSNESIASDEPPTLPKVALPLHKPSKHKLLVVIISVVLLLGVLFWIFKDQVIGVFIKQPIASTTTTIDKKNASEQKKVADPELVKFITPTTGETWLSTRKEISPQGWLVTEQLSNYQDSSSGTYFKSAKDQLAEATPTYQEIGSRAGGTIVLVHSPSEGMNGMYYLLEKRDDGKVAVIVNPQAAGYSDDNGLKFLKDSVSTKVTIFDETTHYDSLNIPAKIPLKNGEFVLRPEYLFIHDGMGVASGSGTKSTLVEQFGASSLYRTEVTYIDTGLTNIGYYMQFPTGTKVSLRYEPNQPSLEGYTFDNGAILQYKDGDGKMVYDELIAIARGCGGNSAAVTRSEILKNTDLVQVGKTNTGRPVYDLKDKTATLYKKAYDEYKETYEAKAVSFDDYVKNHGMVVVRNTGGEFLVYVRGQYAPLGGCAKPVVYLYPTKPTLVDVKVGANVTVSDPVYTAGGWKSVLALPNGQLTYQGNTYGSLFWEGQGLGIYPGIVSGTVVKRSAAAVTIRQQLAEQGLNAQEAKDFMEFWEGKIPNKPYIRLTWLGTAQLNALAPLRITPKPNTVIRVFLDMDGYDAPIILPAQKLSAVARNGFTVVEWGGLTSEVRH